MLGNCWKHCCVKNKTGGREIRSPRKARGRCEDHPHPQIRSLVSPAVKTLKVTPFQRNAYWKQSCMIWWCPTQLHGSSRCAATLIQPPRSKRSLDKVLLILTDPPHAAPHATGLGKTEHYCSLLTAAWHWGRSGAFLPWSAVWKCKFLEMTSNMFYTQKVFRQSAFVIPHRRFKAGAAVPRIASHLGLYHEGCNPQWTEQGLIMIRYTSLSSQ